MHVVMIAGEAAPYAKVGGLADVLGALPPQLEKLGVTVSVIIPRYRRIDLPKFGFKPFPTAANLDFDVQSAAMPNSSVRVFLIGKDAFFDREGIYFDTETGLDYADQADRWIFFQRAALEFTRVALAPVDIIHCHDHHSGLIPAYLRRFYWNDAALSRAKSVFTIHNIGYQGLFPPEVMARTGLDVAEFQPAGPFEFYGKLNFMKAGVSFADLVTTVSPSYAREIQESEDLSFGLNGVLRDRTEPTIGILNGIDYDIWNPQTDSLIPSHEKTANKRALLHAFGLDASRKSKPLLAMISRIDSQKGFDLVVDVLDELLEQDLSFVLLGTGHRNTEDSLRAIVARHPSRASVRFAYDDALSHLIVAGADIFLMPSKYEPCGLTQMYSMRYGTVPVVRATGGLADTVQEFDSSSGVGTGFRFSEYEPAAFRDAVLHAVHTWSDRKTWKTIMRNGMKSDFSWTRSARQYVNAYQNVMGRI